MPAIQPVRLKTQAAHLAEEFTKPARFVKSLSDLLISYSDNTHRAGRSGKPRPLSDAYNTPAPVIRQVWQEIKPLIRSNPPATLALCDALWAHPFLEHRLLAADLLGHLPMDYQKVVIERIQKWITQGADKTLIDALFERSLITIRQQSTNPMLEIAKNWVTSSELQENYLGLRILHYMALHANIDSLPAVFRLISPFLRITPVKLRPYVVSIIKVLIQRTPQEAAYLLRQNLFAPDNPDTAWLLRQVIDQFPVDLQENLRKTLRENARVNP